MAILTTILAPTIGEVGVSSLTTTLTTSVGELNLSTLTRSASIGEVDLSTLTLTTSFSEVGVSTLTSSTGDVCVFQANATVRPAVGVRGVVVVPVYRPVVLYLRVRLVSAGLRRSLRAGGLLSLQAVALRFGKF